MSLVTSFRKLVNHIFLHLKIPQVLFYLFVTQHMLLYFRQILERAVKQKLSTKKLSFLIQKYIRFEETHGSEDQVQHVKDMALTLFDKTEA